MVLFKVYTHWLQMKLDEIDFAKTTGPEICKFFKETQEEIEFAKKLGMGYYYLDRQDTEDLLYYLECAHKLPDSQQIEEDRSIRA